MNFTESPLRLAQRMSRLGTEGAFEVLGRAKQLESEGRDIIHLEIGEPDFPSPPHVVEAAIRALRDGWTHYGPPAGLPSLREAVAKDAGHRRGIHIDPSQVIITPGAKPVFFFSMMALVEQGDEVLYPDPGFPIYESMIRFLGATPVPYALREENGFNVAAADVLDKLTGRTRMVILNSPQNPTGGIMSRAELSALATGLGARDLHIFSDEIYNRLVYDGDHTSIVQFPAVRERTVVLDGFSKSYAMTGWRLGYGIMCAELAEQMTKLMINSNSCTASFTQVAAIQALEGDQSCVDRMKDEFYRRRGVIVDGLNRIPGFRCSQPCGAFYAFPNVSRTGKSARDLADRLLSEAGVACLPGTAFGDAGEGFLRISFANSIENIQRALDRINGWVCENTRL
ncbi:MAG: pyridoxal phosphate-dependent aminotransferase [Terriglobia bacterium]